jgi:2-polyprenyl-3-methyl-5-hydroxy-6-metoxy-1,4-benzoquinol methylase
VSGVTQCPVCDSPGPIADLSVFDDRYGYPGRFEIFQCSNCGHKFLNKTFSSEELKHLYTQYYPRSGFDVDAYQPFRAASGVRSWLQGAASSAFLWVPKKVVVLDIGCGFCESLSYFESLGCDAFGVEADENVRPIADKFGFKVVFEAFSAHLFSERKFDYVTMSQVIEHSPDPTRTLDEIASILKPGGKVVLSTPNPSGWAARIFGARWINWHAPYHLHFFSEGSLIEAAHQAGFTVIENKTITSSDWIIYQFAHLLAYPEPGAVSAYWSKAGGGQISLSGIAIKFIAASRFLLIPQILTRILDAMGVGDNRLVILQKSNLNYP